MFLDTSGLFCYHHADEPRSADAQTLFEAAGPKITQGYVLAELPLRDDPVEPSQRPKSPNAEGRGPPPKRQGVWIDESLHRRALRLLEVRLDKNYSLCDAVSFILMRERGILDALRGRGSAMTDAFDQPINAKVN